jgi:hypothetical protein
VFHHTLSFRLVRNPMQARAPATVWYAPETLTWLCLVLALPVLVVLAVNPLLRGLLARLDARHPQTPEAAHLARPGFRWALLSLLAGTFLTWEAWYVLRRLDPGWLGGVTFTIAPEPGIWAAAYLAIIPGLWLVMTGYVAALGRADASDRLMSVPGAMGQLWLFAATFPGLGLGCILLLVQPSLAWPPLALFAVGLALVLLRRNRLKAQAGEIIRQEQKAEAAALRGPIPERGEYRNEAIWRPFQRTAALYLAAVGVLLPVAALTMGPDARRELLRLWPQVVMAVTFGGLVLVLLMFLGYTTVRRVVWDEHGLEVTSAIGWRRAFGWRDLTSLSVHRGVAHVTAGPKAWSVLESGDGFADLVTVLKARVWAGGSEGEH